MPRIHNRSEQLIRKDTHDMARNFALVPVFALVCLTGGMTSAFAADKTDESAEPPLKYSVQLGDKTVLDALDAAASAAERETEPSEILQAAAAAVDATMERMRGMQAKIGRARIFGERSVGLDDPGMRAFRDVLHGLAAAP